MKLTIRILGLSAFLSCLGAAWAQQAPPPDAAPTAPTPTPAKPVAAKPSQATAQSEAGEPRANTSDPPADTRAPVDTPPPSTTRSAPTGTAPAASPAAGQKAANPKAANATDKLQLGTATVTGDREQPKVMYVVPWKRPDIGDAEGKPMNSLVDEILSPVDRDVFKREVRYYQTINSEASQNGALPARAPPTGGQVEK